MIYKSAKVISGKKKGKEKNIPIYLAWSSAKMHQRILNEVHRELQLLMRPTLAPTLSAR
jgi:hypothetical protein